MPRVLEGRDVRLDGIDGSIGEGSHGTRDQTNDHRLPTWQLALVGILRLIQHGILLELLIRCKVDSLVRGLPKGSERHTAIQCPGSFFADDGECRVRRVPRILAQYCCQPERRRTRSRKSRGTYRYRGISNGSASECCCACNRILMTSIGLTTRIASVAPAPRPAVPCHVSPSHVYPTGRKDTPRNVPPGLTLPSFCNHPLYTVVPSASRTSGDNPEGQAVTHFQSWQTV